MAVLGNVGDAKRSGLRWIARDVDAVNHDFATRCHLQPDERLGETALAVASNTRDPEYLPLGHLHPVHQDGGSGLRVYHKPLDIQTNSCGRAIRSARRPDLVPDPPLSQKRAEIGRASVRE